MMRINTRSIAYRLLLKIFTFSLAATLLVSALQLYINYREEAGTIDRLLQRVQDQNLPSIALSLWVMDTDLLKSQLEGIVHNTNLTGAAVYVDGRKLVEATEGHASALKSREYPIYFLHDGREINLGTLRVDANLEMFSPARIWEHAKYRVAFQALLIFGISLFCFMVIKRNVTSPLERMAGQLTGRDEDGHGITCIDLKRKHSAEGDELDVLCSTINSLSESVSRTFSHLERELAINRALSELSRACLGETTLGEVSEATLLHAKLLAGAGHGFVSVIDRRTGQNVAYTLEKMLSGIPESGDRRYAFSPDAEGRFPGLWGHVLNTKKSLFTNDAAGHEGSSGRLPEGHVAIQSFLSVPVLHGGELIGQIALANAHEGFTPEALSAIERVADVFALAIMKVTAEGAILGSLREKEVLLREIHHRVKNNMAIISSLLKLQASYVKDENDRTMFRESQSRIRSMALVHERLYQSADFTRIDLQDYVSALVRNVKATFGPRSMVRTSVEVEQIDLDIDLLIPCGLLINELLTNAFKYAFEGVEHQREVSVEIRRTSEEMISVTVADNGNGLPEGFGRVRAGGLGLKLVEILAEQLRGTFSIEDKGGAAFTITFPDNLKLSRK